MLAKILTLLLRGDMKGEYGCMSAFIADVYAAHVENMSCKPNASHFFVLYAGCVSTQLPAPAQHLTKCHNGTRMLKAYARSFLLWHEAPAAFKLLYAEANLMTRLS